MPEPARARLSREGPLAILTLDAPERGNALDNAMLTAIAEACEGLAHEVGDRGDEAPAALIIEGGGQRHFCAGYNLHDLLDQAQSAEAPIHDLERHPLERAMRALAALPLPSIASLQGDAFGAGCELAITCDLRLAAPEARLCMPPARLNILYSETGLRRLVQLIGVARAKAMIFTAAPVPAPQAQAMGLVNELVPKDELGAASRALALRIARLPRLALRRSKQLLDRIAAGPLGEAELDEVQGWRRACFASTEFRAAVQAFLDKPD